MSNASLQMVILAGGLATRLRPMTETIPKSLIMIQGEPFIAHQLRLLKKQGIEDIIISTGYLGDQIEAFLGNGSRYGVSIQYVNDGYPLLGTGGAICKALPCLNEAFFVMYGDSYLLCDYAAIQKAFFQSQKQALMTVLKNNGLWDKSNVLFRDASIIAYDKIHVTESMQHIDFGLGIFKKSVFEAIPKNTQTDLAFIYQTLLSMQQLAAFEVSHRFYEIGSFVGIQEFEYYLSGV